MQDLIERIKENEARIEKQLRDEGRKVGRAEGRELGRKAGILENMLNVIKNMLQQNESEEKIMKYTNATREDIEKVKKQLCIS